MEENGNRVHLQNAMPFWAFLQADCEEFPKEYHKELQSLHKDLNHNGPMIYVCGDLDSDGDLETDGHLCLDISIAREGTEPSIDIQGPANFQQIAEELLEIAAQLEHNVVVRATQNLSRNLSGSSVESWKEYLHQEVQHILEHGVGLDNLQQERVIAALTFTLVKGVCERAPRLLKSLFNTAMLYISSGGGR